LEKYSGKIVKVELNDGRKIYGTLQCFDKKRNLVFADALEELDMKYIPEINRKVKYLFKANPDFTHYI